MEQAATEHGATLVANRTYPDFRRLIATRGDEECIVDLVIDRAPMIETQKTQFGDVRVDTLREIAANKICTLLSRSEIKDLVDLMVLVRSGIDLHQAFIDASKKDAAAEPPALAWILGEVKIGSEARLPGGVDPLELDAFRKEFIVLLRSEAFKMARK